MLPSNDNDDSDLDDYDIKPIILVSCDTCEKEKICLRTFDTNICVQCWKLEKQEKSIWTKFCQICGNLYKNLVKKFNVKNVKRSGTMLCCVVLLSI